MQQVASIARKLALLQEGEYASQAQQISNIIAANTTKLILDRAKGVVTELTDISGAKDVMSDTVELITGKYQNDFIYSVVKKFDKDVQHLPPSIRTNWGAKMHLKDSLKDHLQDRPWLINQIIDEIPKEHLITAAQKMGTKGADLSAVLGYIPSSSNILDNFSPMSGVAAGDAYDSGDMPDLEETDDKGKGKEPKPGYEDKGKEAEAKSINLKEEQLSSHIKYAETCSIVYAKNEIGFNEKLKGCNLKYIGSNNDSFDSNGYKAMAFLHEDKVIIASRGTNNFSDINTDCKLITGRTPNEFKEAEQFYLKIKQLFPNKEIILTGHSLGGYYAEMLHLKYNEKCITFDSPGSRKFRKMDLEGKKECNVEANVVLYKAPENIINSTLPQMSNNICKVNIETEWLNRVEKGQVQFDDVLSTAVLIKQHIKDDTHPIDGIIRQLKKQLDQ